MKEETAGGLFLTCGCSRNYAGQPEHAPVTASNEVEVDILKTCFEHMVREMTLEANDITPYEFIEVWNLRVRINVSSAMETDKKFSGKFEKVKAIEILEEFCRQFGADWIIARDVGGTGLIIDTPEKIKKLAEKNPRTAALIREFRKRSKNAVK